MNSTYSTQSQQITTVFEDWPPNRIIIVPLDFAKEKHLARVCLGNGQYLHTKAFSLNNNQKGIEYLVKRINSSCSQKKIQKQHVIIASESPHSYAIGFMLALKKRGYIVVEVDAYRAKTLRKTHMASSDNIDLDGIANAVINRHGKDLEERDEIYHALQASTRLYKQYTKQITAQKNRIHTIIDVLFPGFLSKKKSGIEAFSRVSVFLMSKNFSVGKIQRMRTKSLIKNLNQYLIPHAQEVAKKLQDYARKVIAPPKGLIQGHSSSLEVAISLLSSLKTAAHAELQHSTELFIQTPYVSMLSIPGIGIVRATVIAAELKEPSNWYTLNQTCAFAGIATKTYQSGGEDSAPVATCLPKKCNRRLKDAILQTAHQTGMTPHTAGRYEPKFSEHRLQRHYKEVVSRDGKSGLSTGRLLLRVMRPMVLAENIYLPNMSQGDPKEILSGEELTLYLSASFEKMDYNLKDFEISSVKNNRLNEMKKQWQKVFKNLHGIDLKF